MSDPATPSTPKRRRRHARLWHRWLGLAAAFPLLWLSLSGLLLNHSAALGLNDREVSAGWILKRYHQLPEGDPLGITVGDRKVTTWDGLTFLDEALLDVSGELVGAAAVKNQLVIATDERVIILDGTGDMVLDLDELSLPAFPIQAIISEGGHLGVQSEGVWWRFSKDFLSFEKATFSVSAEPLQLLDAATRERLSSAIQTRRAMPLSRVILDAHSGKLFGWPGWLLTDLTAVGVIILTILGLRLFPKRKS